MTAAGHPYQLVIFDFDGTLSDSGNWFLSIVDDLASRFRFRPVHPDEVEGLRKRTTREVDGSLDGLVDGHLLLRHGVILAGAVVHWPHGRCDEGVQRVLGA